jgi:hypothetical protein
MSRRGPRGSNSRTFLERFENLYIPEPNSGCWIWVGGLNGDDKDGGYGRMRVGKIKVGAHRWAYENFVGSVPDGFELDHLCRVRCCVNPAHLEIVTSKQNQDRSPISCTGRTHCLRGHEFTPQNTYIRKFNDRPYTARVCRTCINERRR